MGRKLTIVGKIFLLLECTRMIEGMPDLLSSIDLTFPAAKIEKKYEKGRERRKEKKKT